MSAAEASSALSNRVPPELPPRPTIVVVADGDTSQTKASDVPTQMQIQQHPESLSKRDKVAMELFETERNYCEHLSTLIDCFMRPLTLGTGSNSGKADLMTPSESREVFANIDHLYRLNSSLLVTLEHELSIRGASQARIGKIMFEFAPFFRVYMSFIDCYQQQERKLEDLSSENIGLQELIKKCEANPRCRGLSLKSFLIMPVQRIPRYKMLLHELAKRTDPNHNDFNDIEKACAAISRVASQINHSIKQQENKKVMLDLRSAIVKTSGMEAWLAVWPGEDLLESHRKLIRVARLVKRSRSKRSNKSKCVFVLLNDTIMYGNSPALSRPASMSGAKRNTVKNRSSHGSLRSLDRPYAVIPPTLSLRAVIPLWTQENKCRLNLRREEKTIEVLSDTKSFDIVCDTIAEAEAWNTDIAEAISVCSEQILEIERRKKWSSLRKAIVDSELNVIQSAVKSIMLTAKPDESDSIVGLSMQVFLKSFDTNVTTQDVIEETDQTTDGACSTASEKQNAREQILRYLFKNVIVSASFLDKQFIILVRIIGSDGDTARAGKAIDILQSILIHRVSPKVRDDMIAQVSGPGRYAVVASLAPYTSSAAKEEAFNSAAGVLIIRGAIEMGEFSNEGGENSKIEAALGEKQGINLQRNRRQSLTMHTKSESAFDFTSSAECLDVIQELAPCVSEESRLLVLSRAACEGCVTLCATLVSMVSDESRQEVLRTLSNRSPTTTKIGVTGPNDIAFQRIVTLIGSSVGSASNDSILSGSSSLTPMARQLLGKWESLEGLLCKRGAIVKSWKTRIFSLQGALLTYHKPVKIGNSLSRELGRIDLSVPNTEIYLPTVEEEKKSKLRSFCFAIHTPERTYFVQASSEEDRHKWVSCIEANISIVNAG